MSWLNGSDDLAAIINAHPQVLFVTIPDGGGAPTNIETDGTDELPCEQRTNGVRPPNVLCVGMSDATDGLACGGYGPTVVDVAVPVEPNVTTVNGGGFGATVCATSFSSPTAAGAATILFGIDPTASAADVKSALVDAARPAAAWQGKSVSGGIVNVEASVRLFQQRRGITGSTTTGGAGTGTGGTSGTTGTTGTTGSTGGGDRTRPTLKVAVSPAAFRPSGLRRGARTSKGARLTAVLSEPATMTYTTARLTVGRRVGGTCRPVTRANARRPRCDRAQIVGKPAASVRPAGRSSAAFGGRGLAAGRYRLTAVAVDPAGNASRPATAAFTLLR
jgi:hypothetical protein